MKKVILDDLDHKLISMLAQDARISNRKIAGELSVTEGTVRARIKKLENENLIRFTAITNFQGPHNFRMAFIRVQAELEHMLSICDFVKAKSNVGSVIITMGRFNLLVIALFDDLDDLHTLASEQILALKGVHHVETAIAVHTVKYDMRIARIL